MIIHRRKTGPVSKSDDRLTLMLLFYIAAVCGWLWEVLVYWGTSGFAGSLTELLVFYRGVLHGPWAPIYGTGGILLVLLYRAVQERKGYFFYCRHGGLYGGGIWNLVDSGSILPRQVVGLFRAVFKSARKDLFRQHCGLFPDWTVGGTGRRACLRRMDSKADV